MSTLAHPLAQASKFAGARREWSQLDSLLIRSSESHDIDAPDYDEALRDGNYRYILSARAATAHSRLFSPSIPLCLLPVIIPKDYLLSHRSRSRGDTALFFGIHNLAPIASFFQLHLTKPSISRVQLCCPESMYCIARDFFPAMAWEGRSFGNSWRDTLRQASGEVFYGQTVAFLEAQSPFNSSGGTIRGEGDMDREGWKNVYSLLFPRWLPGKTNRS